MSKVLEIGLDYDMEPEDEQRLAAYVESGMTEPEALRQVAQDVFGGVGAIVQMVDMVDF